MKLERIPLLLVLLALTAGVTTLSTEQQAKADRMAALSKKIDDKYVPVTYVSISCSGHTDVPVTGYSVRDLISTQEYGSGGCGGNVAAGYPLPKQWRPGMTVKVSWKLDAQPWRETITNIMHYDKVGTLFVHVFNDNQVRVVVSNTYPGGAGHPISRESKTPPSEGQ